MTTLSKDKSVLPENKDKTSSPVDSIPTRPLFKGLQIGQGLAAGGSLLYSAIRLKPFSVFYNFSRIIPITTIVGMAIAYELGYQTERKYDTKEENLRRLGRFLNRTDSENLLWNRRVAIGCAAGALFYPVSFFARRTILGCVLTGGALGTVYFLTVDKDIFCMGKSGPAAVGK